MISLSVFTGFWRTPVMVGDDRRESWTSNSHHPLSASCNEFYHYLYLCKGAKFAGMEETRISFSLLSPTDCLCLLSWTLLTTGTRVFTCWGWGSTATNYCSSETTVGKNGINERFFFCLCYECLSSQNGNAHHIFLSPVISCPGYWQWINTKDSRQLLPAPYL